MSGNDSDTTRIWADAGLSASLSELSSRGEGQCLEFKEMLPSQGHDIGKSIAAFASSGSGQILYGVSDNGDIIGLPKAVNAKERDVINQRISGAAKDVKPPVNPTIKWAVYDERVVCVVSVEKGYEAIYYSNHRPIIRRGATSRPAEPGEVERAFLDRYASGAGSSATPLPSTVEIASRLQTVLARINDGRPHDPLSVGDLALAMHLASPADLDAVFAGRHAPSFELIDRFCDRFAVCKEWVIAGRGAPFKPPIEHYSFPEFYASPIQEACPEVVYAVRSSSDIGEAVLVVFCDDFKAWRVPDVWHVSDHVGGGGSRDLVSLYKLFKGWSDALPPFMILGRVVEPELFNGLMNDQLHPSIVATERLSHWWDDLTDIEHQWTTRKGSSQKYGKGFVAAQDIIRKLLSAD